MPSAWAADAISATKTWDVTLPHSFSGQPKPKFDRGLFLVRDVDFSLMAVYDASGKLVRRSRLSIPGTLQTSITDIAAAPGGTLVSAAGGMTTTGQAANFLAWLSADGAVGRVVRVSPFIPLRICVATDGSVWAAGKESDAERPGRSEAQNHAVLRRYDPEGWLTHSLLARSTFRTSNHPAHQRSSLSCGTGRVGFFSYPANEWIEATSQGELIGRWKGVRVDHETKVSGTDMTSDGSVYATTYGKFRPGFTDSRVALFRLDKTGGRWLPVSFEGVLGPDPRSQYAEIIGTDGTSVVIAVALPKFVAVKVE
jgi:hypothetical protein